MYVEGKARYSCESPSKVPGAFGRRGFCSIFPVLCNVEAALRGRGVTFHVILSATECRNDKIRPRPGNEASKDGVATMMKVKTGADPEPWVLTLRSEPRKKLRRDGMGRCVCFVPICRDPARLHAA